MSLKRFFTAALAMMATGITPLSDPAKFRDLRMKHGLRRNRQGGCGRCAQPPRIASRKSVARFWKYNMKRGVQA